MAPEDGNAKLHVLFLPLFTPSHLITLVNVGRLIAARGVKVTILSTKYNTLLFQSSIEDAIELGHDISIHNLKFPSAEVGLPEGIEYFSAATTDEMLNQVYQGMMLLQKPTKEFIQHLDPHCIVADMHYFRACDFAEELKIPTVLFYIEGFISHCARHNLWLHEPHKSVKSDSETFLIPGLPDRIEMKRSELEDYMKGETTVIPIPESELKSIGFVVNTFYELDCRYADYYRKVRNVKFWTLGPLHYFANKDKKDDYIPARLKESWLNWLDTQGPNRVLLISFGSMVRFSAPQLMEIASALEASNQPFIWVLRKRENDQEDNNWVDGFEERINERNQGLIIKGWAPQAKILSHPSTGGFMSHCGWNSIMESTTAGVPMITWPVHSEQFYNEKFIEVSRLGVRVGAENWSIYPTNKGPLIESKQIEEAIRRVMGDSEESREFRKKAKEVAALAKSTVEEGGSSYQNLLSFIDEMKSCAFGVKN